MSRESQLRLYCPECESFWMEWDQPTPHLRPRPLGGWCEGEVREVLVVPVRELRRYSGFTDWFNEAGA